MLKSILISLILSISINASDYDRANSSSKEALRGLDCEFEDCTPKESKVVYKEKVVIKEVPKEVIVEKVVIKEVIKEVPKEVIVEKVVYRDRPVKTKPTVLASNESSLKSNLDDWEEADAMFLSESLSTNGFIYDKKFIKNINNSLTKSNNSMPLYCNARKGNFQNITVVMNKPLKNYDAIVKYQSYIENYHISIGKIKFSVEWDVNKNVSVKVQDTKPVVISNSKKNIRVYKNINEFRVVSKDGVTKAYINNKLLYTNTTQKFRLRSINVNVGIYANWKGDESSFSDKVFDIGVIKLVKDI